MAKNNELQEEAKKIIAKRYLYQGFSCAFTFKDGEKLLLNNTIYPLDANDEATKKLIRRDKLSEIKE